MENTRPSAIMQVGLAESDFKDTTSPWHFGSCTALSTLTTTIGLNLLKLDHLIFSNFAKIKDIMIPWSNREGLHAPNLVIAVRMPDVFSL